MSRTARGGRVLRRLAALVVVLPAALGMPASGGVAAVAPCTERALQVVAHADDDLLFMNPDVQDAIARGLCVRTVYLTAGDGGRGGRYWRTREAGERAAYARMAGVRDRWSTADLGVPGPRIQTLVANPNVSLVFLRLPDGNVTGEGFARTGNASLERLWDGDIATIATVEREPVTYTKDSLIGTLGGLIDDFAPDTIRVQDSYASFDARDDHPDHLAAARLATAAQATYLAPHTLVQYLGYGSRHRPANVGAGDLARKKAAFYAYSAHDAHACRSEASCTGKYGGWLRRRYVVAPAFGPLRSVDGRCAVPAGVGACGSSAFAHLENGELRTPAGTCLDAGGAVTARPCTGAASQTWRTTPAGELRNGDRCLTVSGARLVTAPCEGQSWLVASA